MKSHFEFNKVYNLDCINGMKIIPSKTVDLVITDPPFGIGNILLGMHNSRSEKKKLFLTKVCVGIKNGF